MHLPLKKNTYISQQFGFFLCQNACRSICIVLFYICFVFENQCVYSIYIYTYKLDLDSASICTNAATERNRDRKTF